MADGSPEETPPDTRSDPSQLANLAAPSPTIDTLSAVLANADRRAIVGYFMASASDVATVSELVDCCFLEVPRDECLPTRDTLTTQLQHTHLPTLETAGIVEYTMGSGTVRYHEDPLLEKLLMYLYEYPE